MLLIRSLFLLCFIFHSTSSLHIIPRTPTPTPDLPFTPTSTPSPTSPTTWELSSLLVHQAQGTYLTNCDWCYGHFSLCHQPTGAPDAVIYSQCYCNTFFQAVYQGCVTDCGWSIAGIPALAEITSTCNSWSVNGLVGVSGPPVNGGNTWDGQVTTTVVKPAPPAPKGTAAGGGGSSGNGNGNNGNGGSGGSGSGSGGGYGGGSGSGSGSGNGSGNSATSGADEKDEERGLLFRVETVVLAGLAVLWVFGWL